MQEFDILQTDTKIVVALVAAATSLLVAIIGFGNAAWLQRERARYERATAEKIQKLQQDLIQVGRSFELHIEREYALYEDVYSKLYRASMIFENLEMQEKTRSAVPVTSTRVPDSEIAEWRESEIEKAREAIDIMEKVYSVRPFIPSDLFAEIEVLGKLGYKVISQEWLKENFPNLAAFGDDIPVTSADIHQQLLVVSSSIKNRLGVIDKTKVADSRPSATGH